jgi:hypothetical protein
MNDDVFPIMLNRLKNKKSCPRGATSEIMICE